MTVYAVDLLELARAAVVLAITIAGPMLLAALITGVGIGLLQALTQIQEQTLTFVPKLLVMLVTLLIFMPMIGTALGDFMREISGYIVAGR